MPHQHTQRKALQLRSRLVLAEVGRYPWKAGEGGTDPLRSEGRWPLRGGSSPPARCDVAIGCLGELGASTSAGVVRQQICAL